MTVEDARKLMIILDNSEKASGCDVGPLPPGCDCICHTPCDFEIEGKGYIAKIQNIILVLKRIKYMK